MARARFSLKAADLLNTGPWIAEDEPVFGKALNGELARVALYNRVRPPEVHVVECLNQGISRCADRILCTACGKDIANQADSAFAFSGLPARFPIHAQAGCGPSLSSRLPVATNADWCIETPLPFLRA